MIRSRYTQGLYSNELKNSDEIFSSIIAVSVNRHVKPMVMRRHVSNMDPAFADIIIL